MKKITREGTYSKSTARNINRNTKPYTGVSREPARMSEYLFMKHFRLATSDALVL